MAVNKLVRELPIKSTVFGGDRILVDDGITKTSFLSSLRTYFLSSDSDAQNLFFNKTYLNITGGNTIPLTGFNNINAEQKLLSAGKDLLQIFVTSESDMQTLSASEEYLNISNGNSIALSALDTSNYFILKQNLPTHLISAEASFFNNNDLINLKANKVYEIEYNLIYNFFDNNYPLGNNFVFYLSANNNFNNVNIAYDYYGSTDIPNSLGIDLQSSSSNNRLGVINQTSSKIAVGHWWSTAYGITISGYSILKAVIITNVDTSLILTVSGGGQGSDLSGKFIPLKGSYRKVYPIE